MFCGLVSMLCNISNILIAVSCLHTFGCLDYDPYPLDPCLSPLLLWWELSVGYRLPILRLPDPLFQMNHRSAVENALFVSHAIDELVLGLCVVEYEFCSIVCSPLL